MTGKQEQNQTCLACQRKWFRVYPLCYEEAGGWSDLIVFSQREWTVARPQWKQRGHWGNVVGVQVADDVLDKITVVKVRSE